MHDRVGDGLRTAVRDRGIARDSPRSKQNATRFRKEPRRVFEQGSSRRVSLRKAHQEPRTGVPWIVENDWSASPARMWRPAR
jgi:hypothetical protein